MNKEDVIFEAEYTLTDDMVKLGIKKWFNKTHKLFSIGTIVVGIMSIFPGILYIGMKNYELGSFFIMAAVMLIWIHFAGYMMNSKAEIRNLHKLFETEEDCGKFSFKFAESGFEQSTKISTNNHMYSELINVIDVSGIIILYLKGRKLFFIDKEGVSDGKAQELLELLNSKMKEKKNNVTQANDVQEEKSLSDIITQSEEKSKNL